MDENKPGPDQVTPPTVIAPQAYQPAPAPPQPAITSQSFNGAQLNSKRKWLVIGGLAVLLIAAAGIFYFLKITHKSTSLNAAASNTSSKPKVSSSTSVSSIFVYMDQANNIQGADFSFTYGGDLDPVAPTMQGKLGRDSKGSLVASVPVDSKLVNQLLVPVNQRRQQAKTADSPAVTNLTASSSYQLDMVHFMASTNLLANNLFYLYSKDEQLSAPACKTQLSALTDFTEQQLSNQKPNYQTFSSTIRLQTGEKAWTMDLYSLENAILPKIKETESACKIDLPYPETWQPQKGASLSFKSSQNNQGATFEAFSSKGQEVFKAQLANINKSKVTIVDPGPSAFVLNWNEGSLFILAADKCKALPVVGSSFTQDYVTSKSSDYTGPSLFDSSYYCTTTDAESHGYQASTL
jgi:hypothetical protein